MAYILTQTYNRDNVEWICEIFYNTLTEAKNTFDKLSEKYKNLLVIVNPPTHNKNKRNYLYCNSFKNNYETITLYLEKEQLYHSPTDVEYNLALAEYGDAELAEILYSTTSFHMNGMEEIEPKWAIWNMPIYACAKHAAKTGRYRIIPTKELPYNFPYKYYGWIDTPENRKKIEEYTKVFTKIHGIVPVICDLQNELEQNEYFVEVIYSIFNNHKVIAKNVDEAIDIAIHREAEMKNPLLTTTKPIILVRDKNANIVKTIS